MTGKHFRKPPLGAAFLFSFGYCGIAPAKERCRPFQRAALSLRRVLSARFSRWGTSPSPRAGTFALPISTATASNTSSGSTSALSRSLWVRLRRCLGRGDRRIAPTFPRRRRPSGRRFLAVAVRDFLLYSSPKGISSRRQRELNKLAITTAGAAPYCGGGWYGDIWEFIVERPVRVDVLRSVMRGDDDCTFAVHLPPGVAG